MTTTPDTDSIGQSISCATQPGATRWDESHLDQSLASRIAHAHYGSAVEDVVPSVDDRGDCWYSVRTHAGWVALVGYHLHQPAILHKDSSPTSRTLTIYHTLA